MKNRAASVGYTMNRSAGPLRTIRVKPAAGNPRRGWLIAGSLTIPVALGRGGILANKREGDGGTPRGSFRPRRLWWRGDRHSRPQSFLPARTITAADAWCEDPKDRHYNQGIRLSEGQGATASSAQIISMTSSSRSTTIPGRGLPAAAARYFCTWPATISARPRAASR
jgi:L,D-peptidoglycan transpeptidase YkuD (ErfK/YbiS/YcfS/YnhG family)